MIITSITSFIIFNFVFNKKKYSKNIFIRFIQKFVIYNLCFILAIYTAAYFNFYLFKTRNFSRNLLASETFKSLLYLTLKEKKLIS